MEVLECVKAIVFSGIQFVELRWWAPFQQFHLKLVWLIRRESWWNCSNAPGVTLQDWNIKWANVWD